jgi:hypothetical protein
MQEGRMKTRPIAAAAALMVMLAAPLSPALAGEPTPTPPAAASCTESRTCADRLGYGNVCEEDRCTPYLDRTDIFNAIGLTEKKQPPPEAWKLYPAIIPAVGYNPALGFLIGAVGTFGMYLGKPDDTTISSATALALVTTEKQLVLQVNSTLMTAANDWELQGDWRFLLYNQDTYGLGTDIPPVSYGFSVNGWGDTVPIPGAQPMKFDLVRLHQSALKRVIPNLYLGGAFRYERYFAIEDESLDLSASPPVVTSHYAYSTYFGFDPSAYTVSGVTLEALYDSRDSTINPYRGYYAQVSLGLFPTWLGSSQTSSRMWGEFRTYLGLSDAVPRNVIAFWVLATGVTSGHQPYLALPSVGWDAKGTTGRGYVQGRLRGTAEVYAEAEWRFRITDNGLLGGAVFANVETMSRPAVSLPAYSYSLPAENLFQSAKPAAGFGLRFMMNKEARTNVRLDFAWGADSFGVYFGSGEAF